MPIHHTSSFQLCCCIVLLAILCEPVASALRLDIGALGVPLTPSITAHEQTTLTYLNRCRIRHQAIECIIASRDADNFLRYDFVLRQTTWFSDRLRIGVCIRILSQQPCEPQDVG
jgi:hypothetical protein